MDTPVAVPYGTSQIGPSAGKGVNASDLLIDRDRGIPHNAFPSRTFGDHSGLSMDESLADNPHVSSPRQRIQSTRDVEESMLPATARNFFASKGARIRSVRPDLCGVADRYDHEEWISPIVLATPTRDFAVMLHTERTK